MRLKQRLQFQRELIRINIFLKDYEERGIKIREGEYPVWLKRFIKECKKTGIPDQVAEEGALTKKGLQRIYRSSVRVSKTKKKQLNIS